MLSSEIVHFTQANRNTSKMINNYKDNRKICIDSVPKLIKIVYKIGIIWICVLLKNYNVLHH